MKTNLFVSVIVVCALLSSAAPAAIISIDDFAEGSTNLVVYDGNATASDSDSSLAGVIGGRRDTDLLWLAGSNDAVLRINFRGTTEFALLAAGPATQGEAALSYGQGGDLNADLTDSGSNEAIQLVFNTADFAGTLTITVETAGVGTSVWTGATPSGLNNVSIPDGILDVPFVDFAGSASFSNVDSITVELEAAPSGDYAITRISAVPEGYVPEPMTLGLLAVGGLAVLARKRG